MARAGLLRIGILGVSHHPYDLVVTGEARHVHAEMLADGIFVLEELPDKCFVDDGYGP